MTHQEFNHIYYTFTKSQKGIKPTDTIITDGNELKEFLEFAFKSMNDSNNYQASLNFLD